MDEEIDLEVFFQRRVKIYNTFSLISLAMVIVGFIVLLLGYLLEWNIWMYTWIGGGIILIALITPLLVRRALRIKNPDILKHLVSENEKK